MSTAICTTNKPALMQPFSAAVEYYYGSDSDGAWSEGSNTTDEYLSAMPSGKYTMRSKRMGQYGAADDDVGAR